MDKIRIAGAAAGVVLVSGVVLQVSSAAFTDATENAGNDWTAGTVYLSDSAAGTALFSSASQNIKPGYTEKQCIQVTYDGTVDPTSLKLDAALTLNAADAAGGDGLADDLDVLVEMGPAGSSCLNDDIVDGSNVVLDLLGTTSLHNGTLAALDSAVAMDTWAPDGDGNADRMRPFRFTVSMADDATTDNDAQGDSSTATFTWTATS